MKVNMDKKIGPKNMDVNPENSKFLGTINSQLNNIYNDLSRN